MRRIGILLILLAIALPGRAEDWTTADGKTYRNVVVIAQEDDGVRITYTGGVGKIPYYELSLDLQKRFGEDYDSLVAKKQAADKALEEANRNAALAAAQKKQQDQAAATQAITQPAFKPQPVPQPSANNQVVIHPGANTQSFQPTSNPPAAASSAANPGEERNLYPGSKFSYDSSQDLCYLDSPPVDVFPVLLDITPTVPNGTLTLRITTDGHKPETPDKVEATFASPSPVKKPVGNSDIKFLVDGTYVTVNELADDTGDDSSTAGQATKTISFYLSLAQARSIINGKNINFSVGSNNYRIDDTGRALLRRYFDDINRLPPASTNFIRSYHHFVAELPSIITMISTVCEYIVVGSFAILLAASVAAFVLGVTRFIKM